LDIVFGLVLLLFLVVGVVAWLENLRQRGIERTILAGSKLRFGMAQPAAPEATMMTADYMDLLARQAARGEEQRASGLWDVSTLAMTTQSAVEKTRGEELTEELVRAIGSTATAAALEIEEAVHESDPDKAYEALCRYVDASVRRRARHNPNESLDSTRIEFKQDLEYCVDCIRKGQLAQAREKVRKWYRSWREQDLPQTIDRPLPFRLMPIALLCTEVILSEYGDSLEWVSHSYVQGSRRPIIRLLKWAIKQFAEQKAYPDVRGFFTAMHVHRVLPYRLVTSHGDSP
jgi:hypothetical protein